MIRIIFPWPSTEFPDQINPRTFQDSGNPGFSMLSLRHSKCPIILFSCKSVLPQCHMTCLYMCSVAFIWSHNCRWYVKSGLPRSFCSWVMARQTDRQTKGLHAMHNAGTCREGRLWTSASIAMWTSQMTRLSCYKMDCNDCPTTTMICLPSTPSLH